MEGFKRWMGEVLAVIMTALLFIVLTPPVLWLVRNWYAWWLG